MIRGYCEGCGGLYGHKLEEYRTLLHTHTEDDTLGQIGIVRPFYAECCRNSLLSTNWRHPYVMTQLDTAHLSRNFVARTHALPSRDVPVVGESKGVNVATPVGASTPKTPRTPRTPKSVTIKPPQTPVRKPVASPVVVAAAIGSSPGPGPGPTTSSHNNSFKTRTTPTTVPVVSDITAMEDEDDIETWNIV